MVHTWRIVVQQPKTWQSQSVSAISKFKYPVEHGGFEPPTPCLPAKWSSLHGLCQGAFASHPLHGHSTRYATVRRFFSGLVVNSVVNPPPLAARGHPLAAQPGRSTG